MLLRAAQRRKWPGMALTRHRAQDTEKPRLPRAPNNQIKSEAQTKDEAMRLPDTYDGACGLATETENDGEAGNEAAKRR